MQNVWNFKEGTFSDNRKFATKSSKKTQYVSDIYLSRSPRRQNSENYLGFPHNSFLHQFQIKTLLLRAFPFYFLFVFHYFERWQQQNNLSLSNFENNFSEKKENLQIFMIFRKFRSYFLQFPPWLNLLSKPLILKHQHWKLSQYMGGGITVLKRC